jgi:hypothetical protein
MTIAGATVIVYGRVTMTPTLSVAATVKLKVPAALGVPLSTPALLNASPVGSVPTATEKATGAVPPVALIVWLYGTLIVVAGSVAGFTVIEAFTTTL